MRASILQLLSYQSYLHANPVDWASHGGEKFRSWNLLFERNIPRLAQLMYFSHPIFARHAGEIHPAMPGCDVPILKIPKAQVPVCVCVCVLFICEARTDT